MNIHCKTIYEQANKELQSAEAKVAFKEMMEAVEAQFNKITLVPQFESTKIAVALHLSFQMVKAGFRTCRETIEGDELLDAELVLAEIAEALKAYATGHLKAEFRRAS